MALDPRLWAIILRYAPRYGLDPRAAAAIAMNESGGRFGAVGDSGTSFGPWQLHVGGALPAGRSAAWANSLAGILYALRTMSAAGARGLHGQAAVAAIARDFERPANPAAEIATALRYYTSPGFARGGGGGGGRAMGGGGGGGGARFVPQPIMVAPNQTPLPSALGSIQRLLAAQAPPQAPLVPFQTSTAPLPSTYADQLDQIHSKLLGA